jgi:hypothetical protein
MNTKIRNLLTAVGIVAASFVWVPSIEAQGTGFHSAGGKITGEAYWPARATTRYMQSARAYVQEYQGYVQRVPRPEPVVVQEVSKTLSGYLDEANKHLATMKKDFASDKETVAAVEAIEKDLAKAVEQNKAMIACCKEEKFDKAMAMTCCGDLAKQLGKIHDDHVALMKKLATKYATAK